MHDIFVFFFGESLAGWPKEGERGSFALSCKGPGKSAAHRLRTPICLPSWGSLAGRVLLLSVNACSWYWQNQMRIKSDREPAGRGQGCGHSPAPHRHQHAPSFTGLEPVPVLQPLNSHCKGGSWERTKVNTGSCLAERLPLCRPAHGCPCPAEGWQRARQHSTSPPASPAPRAPGTCVRSSDKRQSAVLLTTACAQMQTSAESLRSLKREMCNYFFFFYIGNIRQAESSRIFHFILHASKTYLEQS